MRPLERIESVINAFVDAKTSALYALLLRSAKELLRRLEAAEIECRRILDYEQAGAASNHYYMDIVQDLRREILSVQEGEQVWQKRPYLQQYDLRRSRRATASRSSPTCRLRYWKTMMKRLIDYVQMAARCNLSSELIDTKLKPSFTAIASERNSTS